MYEIRTILATISLLLLSLPAFAASNDWNGGCKANITGNTFSTAGKICFEFDGAINTTFQIGAVGSLACLTLNGSTAPFVAIWRCVTGVTATTATCFQLSPEGGATLNGTGGAPSTQRACLSIPSGDYKAVMTGPSAGDAWFSVESQ